MKLLIVLLFVTVLCFSLYAKEYQYFLAVFYPDKFWLRISGWMLIHAAFFWIATAQMQMSNCCRIGIKEVNKTELEATGIFSVSHNPIFLGIIVIVLGLFLIIPKLLPYFFMLTTYFVIQVQIRMEEAFL